MNCKVNPEFVVFVGSMMSSKTTKLLSTLERYKYQKKKILALKPKIDDRYNIDTIKTHSGWSIDARTVETGQDILEMIASSQECYNVIAVDEAFMIPGCADALIWLFKEGLNIVVSTLDISATGKVFDEPKEMMPWATRVEKCAAVCTVCGCDALYTHKKIAFDEEIQVGGAELYEPRCFSHHIAISNNVK